MKKNLESYPVSELAAMSEILDTVNKQMSEFYQHTEKMLKEGSVEPVVAEEVKLALNHKFEVNSKKIMEINELVVDKMKNRLGACVMPKDLVNLTETFNRSCAVIAKRKADQAKKEEAPADKKPAAKKTKTVPVKKLEPKK